MKIFTGKTLNEVIEKAAEEVGVEVVDLVYSITEEKKSLFSKSVSIEVYTIEDAAEYGCTYLKDVLGSLGVSAEVTHDINDKTIRINIESENNPIVIGKNGSTLQALNEITRLAISTKFKRWYVVLLDAGDYKNKKYSKLIKIARDQAKIVQKTKVDVKLDPMTSDERRIIHLTLKEYSRIKTESEGTMNMRSITIKYVGDK